jgi:pentatricopeptide repeat protein
MRLLVLLRSITKAPECGRKNVGGKLQAFQTFTTLNGHESKSWDVHIVNALHLGERNQATTLLSDLVNNNHLSRSNDFLNIFDICARIPDPSFVLETWRIMEENGIKINRSCYFLTIRALCKGGYLEQAFDLMVNIRDEKLDISHFLPVYNDFLSSCAQIRNFAYASKCLDLMEQRVVRKDEVTYSELLKFAVLQQNLPAVREIWIECNKFYNISILALRKFVWSFSELGDLKFAYEALQKMVHLVIQGKFTLTLNSQGKLTNSRLNIPTPSKFENSKEIGEVANSGKNTPRVEFNDHISAVLKGSFNNVIHACARAKNSVLSEQLILQMQNLGVEPSRCTYDGFIRSVLFEKGLPYGLRVLKIMEEKNLKPLDSTYATLTVTCSKNFELDLAEIFLDKISQPRHPHPYNAFLEACDAMDRPELGVRALAKMKKLNLKPDIRTYELLFSLFANVKGPYEKGDKSSQDDSAKRIKAIELDMMRNGVQHSYISIRNLLEALGSERMKKEQLRYLHVAENLLSRTNTFVTTSIYNVVLHSLVVSRKSRLAIKMYKAMTSCGHVPNAATYNIMIDCCSIIRCSRSASAIVSIMIRKGYYPQVVHYTALLKVSMHILYVFMYHDFVLTVKFEKYISGSVCM